MLLPDHMTEDELREWGRRETATRLQEIAEFPDAAQTRAALRRNYASLTAAQAAWAIGQAQRERR